MRGRDRVGVSLGGGRGSLRGFRASGEFIRVPFARGLHALEFFSLGRELRLKRRELGCGLARARRRRRVQRLRLRLGLRRRSLRGFHASRQLVHALLPGSLRRLNLLTLGGQLRLQRRELGL